MKKRIAILLLIATAVFAYSLKDGVREIQSSVRSEETKVKTGDKFLIDHKDIFDRLERPQVLFNHGLHVEKFKKEGCKTCHLSTPEDDLIFEFPFKVAGKGRESIKDAYHRKCGGCHNKMIKERVKSGPVRCGDCHNKEIASRSIEQPEFEFDFAYHETHVRSLKNQCALCHHSYDEELVYEEGTEQSCYYCHDQQKKRGPLLSAEAGLTLKKGLNVRKVCHSRCVNCHLSLSGRGEKAGPFECVKCHTGKYKTVSDLAGVPRPERDQPKKPIIAIENSEMKGVLFDHSFHEKNVKTCRVCHHETLNKCRGCHDLKGSPKGGWINITGAYHDMSSRFSCYGCHRIKKSGQNCAGCHQHLVDMDLEAKGPKKEICKVCHSGKMVNSPSKAPMSVMVNMQKIPENVTIKILEKEYEPSTFPHRKIIGKLIEISNDSKMAVSFHRDSRTTCRGCHHQSSPEAETAGDKPPHCRNCHSGSFDAKNMNKPRLLAAYHRQCLGCHEKMKIRATGCTDCHKAKAATPKDLVAGG